MPNTPDLNELYVAFKEFYPNEKLVKIEWEPQEGDREVFTITSSAKDILEINRTYLRQSEESFLDLFKKTQALPG